MDNKSFKDNYIYNAKKVLQIIEESKKEEKEELKEGKHSDDSSQ